MAVYDGGIIKVGNTLNLEQLITELSSQLPCKVNKGTAGLLSVATGSFATTLASVSMTVATDDVILIDGTLKYSISDGASSIGMAAIFRDSTQVTNSENLSTSISSSGGETQAFSVHAYVENLSGSITFALKLGRFSGAGTIYSAASEIWIQKFKKQ